MLVWGGAGREGFVGGRRIVVEEFEVEDVYGRAVGGESREGRRWRRLGGGRA